MAIDTKKVEEHYGVKYIGFYDIPAKKRDGSPTIREHIYVFYQAEPDTSKGHTNYLGVFEHRMGPDYAEVYLTDASGILEAQYPAYQFEDGSYIASRYRHDYIERNGVMLDGGLDYVRTNRADAPNGYVRIVGDHEEFVAREVNRGER